MKYWIFISFLLVGFNSESQENEALNPIHPCNLLVTLFGIEKECATLNNGVFTIEFSCTSDTTKWVSDWLNGKSRPGKGYVARCEIGSLGNTGFTFNDSSYYLSRWDLSWQDSVGEVFMDTASFETLEQIASSYVKDYASNRNNRIYIDVNLPIHKNYKSFAIKTTRSAILLTIILPNSLDNCVYNQYINANFEFILQRFLSVSFLDQENAISYSIDRE